MADRQPAVLVDRACKYYGKPDKPDYKVVLDNLNMNVEKGIIYGLLGPSGCGKTTLLSCIVGRRKLNSGSVWLLGGKPGEKGSGVPGPKVGYMPQEIALVGEFTVRDAIFYFGRIYGLSPQRLNERFDFLTDLLELSDGGKLIKHLSGGQQRRVSLAAALVHEPELLILDEPCVGLDPVLRERIWEFLSGVARTGTTVIITTHYIDETKQAHKIGLLRDGQFLAEESPEEILRKFNCDTLEDAFYKLALRQAEGDRSRPGLHSPDVLTGCNIGNQNDSRTSSREDFSVVTSSRDVLTIKDKPKKSHATKSRYNAVFIKSLQQFCRNPGGLLFAITFPIVTAVAFFSAVGNDPRDLHIAVVNEEASFSPWGLDVCKNSSLQQVSRTAEDTCIVHMLSCWFIEEMEKQNIYQIPYNSTEQALKLLERNVLYGAMYFHPNFSEALSIRIREGHVEDDVAEMSSINIWIDGTNHQISHYLKRQFYKAYETFTRRAMKACGFAADLAQIPVKFHDPIYGEVDAQFVAFMAPGIMITIIFFLSAMVTSTLMISDRLEGVWERSCVAGVRPQEMLNVHILIQTVVIVVQTLEMIVVGFAGYGLPFKGSLFTAGVLLFLQGVSGMCYGFLLSIYSPNYTVCYFIVTGTFYPMILLCGILWPLEGMYYAIKIIALLMPFTIPTMSLRAIVEKGFTIADPAVYHGILTTLVWILITLGLCFLRLKYKKT